jgi:hypothetical protein
MFVFCTCIETVRVGGYKYAQTAMEFIFFTHSYCLFYGVSNLQ